MTSSRAPGPISTLELTPECVQPVSALELTPTPEFVQPVSVLELTPECVQPVFRPGTDTDGGLRDEQVRTGS